MRLAMVGVILLGTGVFSPARAEEPKFSFPLIKGYGGVATVPQATEQPQKGVRVVFDITAESKPEEVNRGLESVARYLNLNAQAGNAPSDVKLALVLHGGATICALTDEAFRRHAQGEHNPNLPLIRKLREHGVEVLVCGQSLARKGYSTNDVADELTVAASAMTVNINKQLLGFAYLSIP
ncbi:MAG: DsrE family protein [Planctomycetes bacterium]|nr:DsrE family protein [Planctomycetota bacterium]